MLSSRVIVAVLAVLLAHPLGAQLPDVRSGARVRIQAPGIVEGHYIGTVLARSADSLVVDGPSFYPARLPFSGIRPSR